MQAVPNLFTSIMLIAGYESKKLFTQRRGLISLACFTLVWALILLYPVKEAADLMRLEGFKEFISGFAQASGASGLIAWPVAEMAIYWIFALFFFPLFSLLITADQFASDKQRGTLRFFLLNAQRDSIYFGRFLAQMIIQSALIAISVIATIVLIVSRDISLLTSAIQISLIMATALIINLLPYTALMAILSLFAKGARQASIYAVLLWVLISIGLGIVNYFIPSSEFLTSLKLGIQLSEMLNSTGLQVLSLSYIPLIQCSVLLVLGRFYMQRKAL